MLWGATIFVFFLVKPHTGVLNLVLWIGVLNLWHCGLQATCQVVLNLINQRVDQLNHLIGQLHITEVLYCTMQSQAFPLRMGTVCHQTYYLYHTNMLAVIVLYTSRARVRMVNSEHI